MNQKTEDRHRKLIIDNSLTSKGLDYQGAGKAAQENYPKNRAFLEGVYDVCR